ASVGVPRYGDWRDGGGSIDPYLGTMTLCNFIYVDTAEQYMIRPFFGKGWDITGSSMTAAVSYLNNALAALPNPNPATYPLMSHVISYYDGSYSYRFNGLPYGQIGIFGAHVRDESLAITNTIVSGAYGSNIPPCFSSGGTIDWGAYPSGFTDALQQDSLGYNYFDGTDGEHEAGYYVTPGAKQFDFQAMTPVNPRGLMIATADAFGDQILISYDPYQLLPMSITDALEMVTSAMYDYRVMQQYQITDPNLNIKLAAFSPLGLLYKTAVQGKYRSGDGDDLDHPTTLLTYDFFNFINNGQPVWVQTAMREHHFSFDP